MYVRKFINKTVIRTGLTLNLAKNEVGIMFFETTKRIIVGKVIYRFFKRLKIPVGLSLLGRLIDSLGTPLDGETDNTGEKKRSQYYITRGSVNITYRYFIYRLFISYKSWTT